MRRVGAYSSVASAASVLSAGRQGRREVLSANSLNLPLICWYRLIAGFADRLYPCRVVYMCNSRNR